MMISQDDSQNSLSSKVTRRQFVQVAAVVGVGLTFADQASRTAVTSGPRPSSACDEHAQGILNLAYTIERAATTFYYTGLTSHAVLRSPQLAGVAGNPNAVSRNGNRENVANLQAALDQEQKHAQILANVGAVSQSAHFYFPVSAFHSVGYTSHVGSFLWALDHLETACIAIYLAAVRRFSELGYADLALLSVRNLAVECEHRALYRVIAGDDPANNITAPVLDFNCVGDALPFFAPYLTGRGFPKGAEISRPIPLPIRAQTARVVGQYVSA